MTDTRHESYPKYPDRLEVEFSDGTRHWYRYERSGDTTQQMIKEERNKVTDKFVQIFKSRTTMENKLVDEIAEELKAERSVTTNKVHEHIMRRFMKKE